MRWQAASQDLDWLRLHCVSWRPNPLPSQAQQASFLPAEHFGNLLFFARLHTTASFSRERSVRVCTTLIYILTRFKSTALSAIIITHLLKGSAQSLLHLRRAAAGSCPSAPSKHTSGTAWYPNSFSTHLKPLHSNGVMAAQWSGGASAAQRRLDIIFLGAAAAAMAAGERRQCVFDSCRRPHTGTAGQLRKRIHTTLPQSSSAQ